MDVAKRLFPVRERYYNSFGNFEEENYCYACKQYEAYIAGDAATVAYWNEWADRQARIESAKKENRKAYAAKTRDNLTEVAKAHGVTKKALVEALKKNQKLYNDVRFKGIAPFETIAALLK